MSVNRNLFSVKYLSNQLLCFNYETNPNFHPHVILQVFLKNVQNSRTPRGYFYQRVQTLIFEYLRMNCKVVKKPFQSDGNGAKLT